MKKLKSILAVLICTSLFGGLLPASDVLAASSVSIPEMYQSIPVVNAGFEEPFTESVVPGWPAKTANSASVTAAVYSSFSNSGSNSFYIKDASTTSNAVAESQKIKVEAGETYEYSAQVYIKSGALKVYLAYYNSAGAQTGSYSTTATAVGKWNILALTKTAPANTDYAVLKIACDKGAVGEGYFDDISFSRVINTTSGKIVNSGFEMAAASDGTIQGWNIVSGNQANIALSNATDGSSGNSLEITNKDNINGVALESYPIGVSFSGTYSVSASVYSTDYSSAGIELGFYDSNGTLVDSFTVKTNEGDAGKWATLSVKGTAPAEASYAAVRISKSVSSAAAYFDNITFKTATISTTGTFTNLGTQVTRAVVPTGAIVMDPSGNPLACVSVNGDPGKLAVIDVKTAKIIEILDLVTSKQSWAMMADEDNSVYIGSVNLGNLYRYVPGSGKVEDLGVAIPGEINIYGIVRVSNELIYGATYPGGKLFEYNTTTKTFRDLGVVSEGEKYAKAIVYDQESNSVYVGTGAHCKIIRYDIATGNKSANLLSDSYSTEEYPNHIDIIGDKLFVALNKSSSIIVMDKNTGIVDYTIPTATKRIVKSSDGTKAYVFSGNYLSYYDLATKTLVPVLDLGSNFPARALRIVNLNLPDFPGETLVAWISNDMLFKYNLQTGNYTKENVTLPGQATDIRTIYKGPDGKIYSGGMLGGLATYDPVSDKTVFLGGVSQPEGMTNYGDILYLGVYPNARITKFDTTMPFNTNQGNPSQLYQIPVEYLQDRPFGMAVAEDLGKMFIGTQAQYGQMGGTFSVYDLLSGNCQTYANLIYNQTIVSLLYKDGKVYGSTSIWGALGVDDSLLEKEAKFFVWDVASGKKELEIVPVPGARTASGLITGPDGKIWGVAEGYLFIFNPETKSVVFTKQIAPITYSGMILKDADLSVGTDGNVYGTTYRYFFKVDAASKKITILNKTGSYEYLVQDDFGNFYFRPSDKKGDLWRYTDPNLIVKLTAAQLSSGNTNISLGGTGKLKITGILEKGRTASGLERGNVQYTYSKPGIISIGENGLISPLSLGETSVTATVTVDGVTVQSNTVTFKVLDNNAKLGDLKVYGQSIPEFTPDNREYTVELPFAMPVPEVTATSESSAASVKVIPALSIPGVTTVEVTAEDGMTKIIYKVNFTVAPAPEDDKELKNLLKELKELREVMKNDMDVRDAMKIYQEVKEALKEYKHSKLDDEQKAHEKALNIINQAIKKARKV